MYEVRDFYSLSQNHRRILETFSLKIDTYEKYKKFLLKKIAKFPLI